MPITFKQVFAVVFLVAFILSSSNTGFALENSSEASSPTPVRIVNWPIGDSIRKDSILILKNTSQVLRFDRTIVRIAISNPSICDVTNIGNKDVLVYAKEGGVVNLFVWDEEENIATYTIESTLDTKKLQTVLSDIDQDSNIKILPLNKSIAVYGTTETSIKLKQMGEAVKAFDPNVLNFVKLRDPKQILLEVRFAEIDRKANKDFKLDLDMITNQHEFEFLTGQTGASNSFKGSYKSNKGVTYDLFSRGAQSIGNLNYSYFSKSIFLQPYLNWLEQRNILKVIARPNLVAKDGEEAKFLVGGSFPVPTASTSGVSIEYKDFGTQLKFTPEILDNDVIRMKVETEVSELDFSSTVTSGGTTVPIITKRTHQTVAEMKDNQTLVIGGILTQKISKINRKFPILGDMPLISPLFKADSFARTDVELVIVMTPHVVRPMELGEKKELYNPQDVKRAVEVFTPPYPDSQADSVQHMITMNETRDKEFGQIPKKDLERFADDMAKKMEDAAKTIEENKPRPRLVEIPKPKTSFIKPAAKAVHSTYLPSSNESYAGRVAAQPAVSSQIVNTPPDDIYIDTPFYKNAPAAPAPAKSSFGNKGVFSSGYVQ